MIPYDAVSLLTTLSCSVIIFALLGRYLTDTINIYTKKQNTRHHSSNSIHILILYCNYTSHEYWSKTYKKYSNHTVSSMSINGSGFKWRMQASAFAFAKAFIQTFFGFACNDDANSDLKNQICIQCDIATKEYPHVILIDDMIDLNVFSNIITSHMHTHNVLCTHSIKYIYFMHENQLTIPWKHSDRSIDKLWIYGLQNFKCMLGAHQIWWNSRYHADDFFTALPKVIKNKSIDDWTGISMIKYAQQKSKQNMYIPMDFDRIHEITANIKQQIAQKRKQIKDPIILWNARWESDKNPSLFLYALRHIKKMKDIQSFKLVIVGENFSRSNKSKHGQESQSVFDIIYDEFKENILQFGYVESYKEYILWLHLSDILIITSAHEFFGISLMESMYCETIPILPNNLVYVEHFERLQSEYPYFYNHKSKGDLVKKCIDILQQLQEQKSHKLMDIKAMCKQVAMNYNATAICRKYDDIITHLHSESTSLKTVL